ncbi:type VII secretion protein EssC [Niallia sp. XMNu-256]|uniref:type VII secretion protein EssC n=1 Tax=Niallia sp. XMNu-256 TaxID=3082444 RepID=UPI0030CD6E9B
MQLSLLKQEEIYTCILPEKKKGQYWVTQKNEDGSEERVISVEGFEDHWVLKSNKHAVILSQGKKVKETKVENTSIYTIRLTKTGEDVILLSEPITRDRKQFKKLRLPREGSITIGRADHSDIRYYNPFTSSLHAQLVIHNNGLSIQDTNSSNGTFVNGKRVHQAMLKPGDLVYILGFKIIIGNGFIALNNPNGQVTYKETIFKNYIKHRPMVEAEKEEDEEDAGNDHHFYVSPRFKRDIEEAQLKIDGPPALTNMEETPLMLMLGPSITMGMASVLTAYFTVTNVLSYGGNMRTAMPSVIMSISMLLGMILWPILTRKFERRKRAQQEKIRQEKYRMYLKSIRQQLIDEAKYQEQILHENYVTIEECIDRIIHQKRNLWERTHLHDDFLKLRLGTGTLPLSLDLQYPEKRFTVEDDVLQAELDQLVSEPRNLHGVPVSLSFKEDWISGIIGNRHSIISLTKRLIVQFIALHSYEELKLVFLYDEKEQDVWDFVKWLPHVWDNEGNVRFIATTPQEAKELSAFLEGEILSREGQSSNDESLTPYYVIFAMNKSLAAKAEMIGMILKQKRNIGFSVIHLYDEIQNLPKECTIVVQDDGNEMKMYDKDDITGQYLSFKEDPISNLNEMELATTMANIKLDNSSSDYTLPTMITFLDMFEVGKIEHLNALTRWQENDPTRTLETPVGVDTSGEMFHLDLHEKFHGPHGLVAGMTGSGKSEFIMSFILSLAVNYHPHEVAFILIDYKGGGMAHAFTDLPHLAGTITNLDGAAINRSLVSIQSELKRRQAIFNEAATKLNTSNIDIYKYQRLYREGQVTEPLQHLFIISDEFAELKTQQPEFMEQLVSAARIGRSLGIHLILATQKPSGVVDDQIWSNSKFRVSLKVQEKADSMDMIKRPDAAELTVTGRFYLQVGFNELFELGQSAWSGAPYYPSDRVIVNKDKSVVVIDKLGRPLKQVVPSNRQTFVKNPPKQIDEINDYLAGIAKEENIHIRRLWLEPIPEFIFVDELKQKYGVTRKRYEINPVIGELDDPANQRQLVLTFPLSREGNAIIYGSASSGKTTFLTTLVYSLMEDHSPSELNLYILDFSAETLRAFEKAPHVGDVLLSHETEKIHNLFKMLDDEISTRKKLFADYGGDYYSYVKATGEEIPAIVVMIHNYSAFTETYEEMEDMISYLTREGTKYGIYFIVTALNTGAVRYRLLQNFKQLFVLQQNDSSDYSAVLGNTNGVYPSKFKGRGIFKRDEVYEFQIAHVDKDVENTFAFIRNYCSEQAELIQTLAKRIPILPEKVDIEYLEQDIDRHDSKIPVGVEKVSLLTSYLDLGRSTTHLLLSQFNDNDRFLHGMVEVFAQKNVGKLIVIDPEGKLRSSEKNGYEYAGRDSNLNDIVVELFNLMVYRNNTYKDAIATGEQKPVYEKVTCIITSFTSLTSVLTDDSLDKLKILLEKNNLEYHVTFVINESAANISSFSFETWFTQHVSLSDGIWVGNGIAEQYQFKLNKLSHELYQEIEEDFGYVIKNGKPTLVKLVTSSTLELEVMV